MGKYEDLISDVTAINQKYDLSHYGYGVLLLVDSLEKLDNESNIGEISDDIFEQVLISVQNAPVSIDEFMENVYEILEDSIPNLESILDKKIELE